MCVCVFKSYVIKIYISYILTTTKKLETMNCRAEAHLPPWRSARLLGRMASEQRPETLEGFAWEGAPGRHGAMDKGKSTETT